MGCMGMSMDDFCRCTPSEFYAAHAAWQEARDGEARSQWERTRMQCLCMLQPYSKKRLRAQDVMQLPWDSRDKPRAQGLEGLSGKAESTEAQKALSHDELMARYRAAKKRMGIA